MAKDIDTGMDKQDMKRLLMKSKSEPVNCSLAPCDADKSMAYLLLDRVKAPRAVDKDLTKKFPDASNSRWGTALVDVDTDAKLVQFRLNKPISGIARKLVKTLKGTGFSKIEILLDDGTSVERGSDEDEERPNVAASGGSAPQPAMAAEPSASAPADGAEAAPAAQPAAAEAAAGAAEAGAPSPDMDALTSELTALVKRMIPLIAADPSRQNGLKGLAVEAQDAVKAGKPVQAKAAIGALEQAVGGFERAPKAPPASAGGGGGGEASAATLAKARAAWLATRSRVDSELTKLLDAIRTTYKEHGGLAEIEKHVQGQLDTVLDSLDEDLAEKLAEVEKVPSADRPRVIAEAKQILKRYQQHIATDKVVGLLDDNPFVPIAVQKTVAAAISALSRSIV